MFLEKLGENLQMIHQIIFWEDQEDEGMKQNETNDVDKLC